MKNISTKNAPSAVGPYSQGVLVKDTLYVSGQMPFVPETMTLISNDIKDQTKQSLNNILAIVHAARMEKEDIVRCGVFMTDLGDFSLMNEVYSEFFGSHKPARAAVEVRRLPKDVLIEIDAIAVKS
ncbi:MAG: RidA family protein [Firmicutes bacterium]|nr:RidA family protein [Bacillota bacterium]